MSAKTETPLTFPVVLPALVLYKGFEKCFKKGHSG